MKKLILPVILLVVTVAAMGSMDLNSTVHLSGMAALVALAIPVAMCAMWAALFGRGLLFWLVVFLMVWTELTLLGVVDGDLLKLLGVA